MLFVNNPSLDPWFNLAAEEYLLKNVDSEITMLWRSHPSVIVGKHQNTLAEINLSYVMQNNIPVIRRLSGGGTVFHDPGNVNFTFIKNANKDNVVNFREHTEPVIAFLQTLGLDARFEGKNDLRVNGLKISGNAEHVHKNKVLHHGTLLFDANLSQLNEAIKGREQNFQSKAVRSIRSNVVNISALLPKKLSRDKFLLKLRGFFLEKSPWMVEYNFNSYDIDCINELMEGKYKTWDWNFGYSPSYTFENSLMLNGNDIFVQITVEKGLIKNAIVEMKNMQNKEARLMEMLKGKPHRPDIIETIIFQTSTFEQSVWNGNKWKLLGLFF